jgi:hypothetical protein
MKKKLEAELISIAHRILKLKNKSEVAQLHQEAQKLYEKLSVLLFVEEHFGEVKPTIGIAEITEKLSAAFEAEEETIPEEPTAVIETAKIEAEETPEPTIAPVLEEINEEVIAEKLDEVEEKEEIQETESAIEEEEVTAEEPEVTEVEEKETTVAEDTTFKPAFELAFDSKETIETEVKEPVKKESPQISFDDLLGPDYVDPVFVRAEDLAKDTENKEINPVIPIGRNFVDTSQVIYINKDNYVRSISLNDRLSKGIIIGLNDRIAFMKNLFANSSEDYNRVLSQLITFDSYAEAQTFIDTMVKPDYNNWDGKDEYAQRFMEIIEKRFS